jgi:hypothetical protein
MRQEIECRVQSVISGLRHTACGVCSHRGSTYQVGLGTNAKAKGSIFRNVRSDSTSNNELPS